MRMSSPHFKVIMFLNELYITNKVLKFWSLCPHHNFTVLATPEQPTQAEQNEATRTCIRAATGDCRAVCALVVEKGVRDPPTPSNLLLNRRGTQTHINA